MKKKSTDEQLQEINKKLDIILNAFCLGQKRMKEEEDIDKNVNDWKKKQELRTMKIINAQTGEMKCQVCGYVHNKNDFKPRSFKKFHCANKCTIPFKF